MLKARFMVLKLTIKPPERLYISSESIKTQEFV